MSDTAPPPSPLAPSKLAPPPRFDALERRVRRFRVLDFALLIGLLAASGYLAFAIATQVSLYALFVAAVLLLLSYCIHLSWTLAYFAKPKTRLVAMGATDRVGRYSVSQIYLILQELLAPHRGHELPEVYLTTPRHDGAYVLNSLLFNRIKPLNAVYIARHLFTLLQPGEIKAILAHELAHFYGYIRPLNRARFALMAFNALLPTYLALHQGVISFWSAIALWLVLSPLYMRALNAWLSRTSRDFEYLCDLSAARRYGVLNIVNGLLGVIRTTEIQTRVARILLARIRSDDTLSIEKLETLLDQCEEKLAAGPVRPADIEAALDAILSTPEGKKLRRKLSKSEQAEEEKSIHEMVERLMLDREFQLIDWGSFDNVTPDGRLDPLEYERLIEALETRPDEQLFDIVSDNVVFAARGSHPTVAERIRFLEQARQQDPTIGL